MSVFKKILALVLVCLMCLTVLTACELLDGKEGENGENNDGDTVISGTVSSGNSSSNNSSGGSSGSTSGGGSSSSSGPLSVEPVTDLVVRSETAKITDSGRQKQKMDVVYLSHYYDLPRLISAGYEKLKVNLSMDVREIDDGYQYFFFYSDTKCNANNLIVDAMGLVGVDISDDPSFLYGQQFEHGSGKKNTSWSTHTFEVYLDLGDLKDNLYIRYGASGSWNDDWQNKNVTVTLTPVKGASQNTSGGSVGFEPVNDIVVRADIAKITDSGRQKQKMDVVYLSQYYSLSALRSAGYTRLKIKLSMDVREIDDGYQYFFFYSDTECKAHNLIVDAAGVIGIDLVNDPSLLYGQQFEHGSGKKNTSWSTHSFDVLLNLSDIKDNLYIRYGASGNGNDDWQNKNVTVSLEPLKR